MSLSPEFIKKNSFSNQLDMTFQLLIKIEMLQTELFSGFQTLRCYIYPAHKYQNANNWWHFNIYDHDKFHAQLSWHEKGFITSRPGSRISIVLTVKSYVLTSFMISPDDKFRGFFFKTIFLQK